MLKNIIYFCKQGKYSEEVKDTEAMKYIAKYLLPVSGSKICVPSSTQNERHSVTNWYPVASIGAIVGSTGKWSKYFNEMRNQQGTKLIVSSLENIITIVKSLLQQFYASLATSKFNWAWLLTR